MRDWSVRLGLVDRPDHKRKLHNAATPRTGGVPILVSYAGAYALLLLLPLDASGLIEENFGMILRLLPPVGLVFATGLLDDWLNLKPWQKLLGELAAAIWAYEAGVRILGVAGHAIPAWCSFLVTVAWLILCSNAFNLIDGIDGLATGVGLTATMTTLIAGILNGDATLALATAPLVGCLIGFLRYNFNPASIFLGDSGSLLIGFLLGSYGVIWSQKSATMLGFAAPAMALALPLLEVGLSIVRRFLRNEPIFSGDRGHIHHRLLERGFTPRRVALLLYAACGVGAALSLLQSVMRSRFTLLVLVLFGVATWIGVHYLKYVEFESARLFLWVGLRPMLSSLVKLKLLEGSLLAATSVEQCWSAVEHTARSLGYSHMTARLGGVRFATAPERAKNGAFWQMRLNLPENDYLNITQREGSCEQPVLVIPFIDTVRRILPEKLAQLGSTAVTQENSVAAASLSSLAGVVERSSSQGVPRNSRTRTVTSSDCAAPSVNAATAS
ncbi:MAG: undecaprenyl/decaprenyl-phosphate alpha-N-acetylglucosaminyl 1-phosphate transferase [Acidobacteriia bacterium]|nr:undecaprenyl/decaprenyl-phosphate alpha-N-acetylglucosaminyl 1-phosphate transferase [Terriglobia bacterium]